MGERGTKEGRGNHLGRHTYHNVIENILFIGIFKTDISVPKYLSSITFWKTMDGARNKMDLGSLAFVFH